MAKTSNKIMSIEEHKKFVQVIEVNYKSIQQKIDIYENDIGEINRKINALSTKIASAEAERTTLKEKKSNLKTNKQQEKRIISDKKKEKSTLQNLEKTQKKEFKKLEKEIKALKSKQQQSLKGKSIFTPEELKNLEMLNDLKNDKSASINNISNKIKKLQSDISSTIENKKKIQTDIKLIDNKKKELNQNIKRDKKAITSYQSQTKIAIQNKTIANQGLSETGLFLKQEEINLQNKTQEAVRLQENKEKEIQQRRQAAIKQKQQEQQKEIKVAAKATKLGITPLTNEQATIQINEANQIVSNLGLIKVKEQHAAEQRKKLEIQATNIKAIQQELKSKSPIETTKRGQLPSPPTTPSNNSRSQSSNKNNTYR